MRGTVFGSRGRLLYVSSIILMVFSISSPASAKGLNITHEIVPTPWLMEPVGGNVSVQGKDFLDFKWTNVGKLTRRRYYDFRIYEGLKITEEALMFEERVEPDVSRIRVKISLFIKGATYTWSVRQVYNRGLKSRRNFTIFEILP